jgi:AcrR family transcriptional regulator
MYCGSNKTALASQRQIAIALLALLGEQPYNDISICAICKRADVSRQTFYSLFQSKENVISFALRNECCYRPSRPQSQGQDSFRQVCSRFSHYIIAHADVLTVLAQHDLMPLLHNMLRKEFTHALSFSVPSRERLQPYMADYLAASLTSIAETYVRTDSRADEEELGETIYLLMRGAYYE